MTARLYWLSILLHLSSNIIEESDRSAPKEAPKNVKATASYSRLSTALQHRWTGLTKRQTKELNPAVVHIILGMNQSHALVPNARPDVHLLALWEYQHIHEGKLPDHIGATSELGQIANSILASSDVNRQVLTSVPPDLIEYALLKLPVWG